MKDDEAIKRAEPISAALQCWRSPPHRVLVVDDESMMKTNPTKKQLTFGDFVAGSYCAWGKQKAIGIIRLAIKSHLIEFRGQQRIVIA